MNSVVENTATVCAFIVAGTRSGCGKTTVSTGIMAALARRGLKVQPYKCGPDFIDPTLHREVCGRASRNLDIRMCGKSWTTDTFNRGLARADVAVIEGVMGMFDGGDGSAAALAKHLDIPVVLVVDVKSRAESVAAVVKGFSELDPEVKVAGVICNRVGSQRHRQLVEDAVNRFCRVPVFGFLPREEDMALPSRHLGLRLGPEQGLDRKRIARMAAIIEKNIDLETILSHCRVRRGKGKALPGDRDGGTRPLPPGSREKIAVAVDRAFCFYYQDNLDLLQAAGAELLYFSPLTDRDLPAGCTSLYLGGGYPELFAAELAANRPMLTAIRRFCGHGGPCYAECGGFMYLCDEIEDQEQKKYPMAGIFPVSARMGKKRRALGYREIKLRRDCILGPAGTTIGGHEFHYSEINPMPEEVARLYRLDNGAGEGFCVKNTLGGYVHLHFGSNPGTARRMAGS